MTAAAELGGWVAAGLTAAVALLVRQALGSRMERVARACHELRGPITAARLGLELGTRGGELSPARLRAIDAELGRAALALDDLARVRVRPSPPGLGVPVRDRPPVLGRLEPVDVGQLLNDSAEAWRAAAAAAGKTVRVRCPDGVGCVPADRLRLAQAAGNLIANAIEHGGATVEVRGTLDPDQARIEVSDNGPGLPAPVAELGRRARNGRGSRGRGLAIAASIATAHGGSLHAAPTGRGARLVLAIPRTQPPTRRRRR